MTRSSAATRVLPQPYTVGAVMLGAALALVPLSGRAQDSQAAPAETGQAAPMENASPAANTGGQAAESGAASAAGGDTGAPSPEASAGAAASAESTATPSPEAAAASTGGTGTTAQLRQAGGTLHNAEGAEIGNVAITETESGVMHVILDIIEGAIPAGEQRGLHIHQTGQCEGPTFESAGGHLAGDKEHGVHSVNGPHPGDLPNITMGASGALHVEYFLAGVQMDQILDEDGSAVMIHSDVDDYTTQPSGNAGDRIACAVLEPTA